MTGKIGVLQRGVPVDLKIKADNAQPVASNCVTANLNADLRVSGTARERLDIAGTVHLNRALIGIPNSLPPMSRCSTCAGTVSLRRRSRQTVGGRPGRDGAGASRFLVQGRGLDAEMSGDLHFERTTDSLL